MRQSCQYLLCVLFLKLPKLTTDPYLQADKVTNWIRPLEGGANGVVVTLPPKYRVSTGDRS